MTGGVLELDGRTAWRVVGLLFLAQVINFFDKTVIGLAAVPIMTELGLSSAQYGLVASSFFSLYAVSGVLVGLFLADRVRTKPLLAVLVLIWSVSALPIVFMASLTTLIACRVVLGIGEGPASPSSINACHDWFSPAKRNMPTALVTLGSSVGSLLAGPILSAVIVSFGWRAAFLVCSALGFLWLALWLALGADGPGSRERRAPVAARDAPRGPAAGAIWTDPTTLGSIAVGFAAYWVVGFTIAWLAPLMQKGLGFDQTATGWIVSAAAGVNSIVLLAIAWLSERMLAAGASSRAARGCVNAACMIGGGLLLAGAALTTEPMLKIALVALGGALPTLTFALGPALISGFVPAARRGRTLIPIYAGITIAGFISPWLAGRIIGDRGIAGFDDALLLNAAVVAIGGVAGWLLLHPERSAARLATIS